MLVQKAVAEEGRCHYADALISSSPDKSAEKQHAAGQRSLQDSQKCQGELLVKQYARQSTCSHGIFIHHQPGSSASLQHHGR